MALYADQNRYGDVRSMCYHFADIHPNLPLADGDSKIALLERINTSGSWGGEPEILLLSEYYNINVLVMSNERGLLIVILIFVYFMLI